MCALWGGVINPTLFPVSKLDARVMIGVGAAFAAMCLEQGSATLRLAQDKDNVCEILS